MPEIREIDEFKEQFIKLGDEPAVRSKWGEALPDIQVPEEQKPEGLDALFDDAQDELLDGLYDDEDSPAEPEPPQSDFDADQPDDDQSDIDMADFDDVGFDDLGFGSVDDEEPASGDEFSSDFGLDGLDDPGGFDEPDEPDEPEQEIAFDDADDAVDDLSFDEPSSGVLDDSLDFDGFDEIDQPSESSDELSDEFSFDNLDLDEADDIGQQEIPQEPEPPQPLEGDIDFAVDDSETASGDVEDEFSFDDSDFDESEEFSFDDTLPDMDASGSEFDEPSLDDMSDVPDTGDPDDSGDIGDAADEGLTFDDELESFDSLDMGSDDFGDDSPGDGDGEEFSLEDLSLEEIDDEEVEATEFSLGDLGQEFGVDEDSESDVGALETLDSPLNADIEEVGGQLDDESYAIPDDEWEIIKKTLGRMPRNLKILIEELIGEKNLSGENLDKLLKVLTEEKTAKDVAAVVSKITGKKIKIPLQYERRSAEEFEKEKQSFSYMFRKNFIPMFVTASVVAAFLGLILFIGYRFVYRPLHAESLYKKGYQEIYNGNNKQANAYFDKAFSEWRKKGWFFEYAEGFADNKQYILAEEKYEQLLRVYPDDRQGILDYASLEFKTLGKYPEAEKLLKGLLFDNLQDFDARLLLGDNYLEWAREIDPEKYEDARFNYATLLEQYGRMDMLLFRMMRYFIRTDKYDEVMRLYNDFQANKKADIEPEVYAELAGYLIDKNHLDNVRDILFTARDKMDSIPEIHYELARYFNILDIPFEEEKALLAAITLFENTTPLTRTRTGFLIDSYNRYGKVLYNREQYIDSEEYFSKAAMNYEEALEAGQLRPDPKYGTIYSNLGDLAYYIGGNYDQALGFFERAEANGYSPFELKYKKGFINYTDGDFQNALTEFYDTADGYSVDSQLLYSTANTLFNRNDYFLAEGYYAHLKDILEKEYSTISYILIDEIPEHRTLVENLMKVSNNLGVTKYRLYLRSSNPEKSAEAMVLFSDASEYYDTLARDQQSLEQPETVNLSYLNSKAIFYPVPDYSPQIYQNIPKDLNAPSF